MTPKSLLKSFDEWRAQGQALVLASVFETAGSTYSKAGARMLINFEGDFQGMLSGGCLEGDLAERAHQVLDSGTAQMVTQDRPDCDVDGLHPTHAVKSSSPLKNSGRLRFERMPDQG